MAKQDSIRAKGEITSALSNGTFNVRLTSTTLDKDIYCILSGKIRKNSIRVMPGDEVEIEMSPYDLTKGRIVRRLKTFTTPPPKPTHRRLKK